MYTYKVDGLQQLFDKSSDAMMIACDGVFVDCNDAAVALFEASTKNELLLLHPSVVSPEYQPDGESSLDKANRMLKTVTEVGNHRFEWQHKTLKGRTFWVDINITLISTDDGKELQYTVLRDITSSKQYEMLLYEMKLSLESEVEAATIELSQTVSHLKALLDSADYMIFATDINGIITTFNRAGQQYLGYTESEVVGKVNPSKFLLESEFVERANSLSIEFGRDIEPGFDVFIALAGKSLEWTHIRADGTIFPTLLSVTIIRDKDGVNVGSLGIARDITVAKEQEKALQELHQTLESKIESRTLELQQQSQFLSSIYDGIDTPIYVYDVNEADLTFYSCNQKCESMLGFPLQAMQNKKATEIFGDYAGKLIEQRLQQCAAQLQASVYEECLQINGEKTWWMTTITPFFDANMKVYRLIGTSFNITELKKAESLLRSSEMRWRNLFEKCADAMAIQDSSSGLFIDCNEATVSMLGYDNKMDIVGKSPLDTSPYLQPDGELTVEKVQYNFAKAFEKGSHKFEWLGKKRDGSNIYLEVVLTLINYDDRQCFQCTWRDITDRMMIQAELQSTLHTLQSTQAQLIQNEKMSSLGLLVAGIAHEINNPVSFIYSNIDPALEHIEDLFNILDSCNCNDNDTNNDLEFLREDLPKLLNSMLVGAERIKQIVLSLRNFSRADEAPIKEVDIHEGIDSTLMILGHKLKLTSHGKKINIIKNYSKFPAIECYPSQLNQVFMNLLSNAIDAVDGVELPQIEITTSCIGEMVEVLIRDNGVGISDSVKNKIFDPFYTTKPVGKGTGMGLGISYQIIERHQGKIWYDSQSGEGTTFALALPTR
jgi:PAS domain S-box-containing protein